LADGSWITPKPTASRPLKRKSLEYCSAPSSAWPMSFSRTSEPPVLVLTMMLSNSDGSVSRPAARTLI
jgi:hypothetical protein